MRDTKVCEVEAVTVLSKSLKQVFGLFPATQVYMEAAIPPILDETSHTNIMEADQYFTLFDGDCIEELYGDDSIRREMLWN